MIKFILPFWQSVDWQMDKPPFDKQFQRELETAITARASGNEGKARVCARRAAGVVLGEYFTRRGISPIKPSAYDRLRDIQSLGDVPSDVIQVVDHFLLRVDRSQQLPIPVDLIEDARWLRSRLLD
jgi:hypothetical protein